MRKLIFNLLIGSIFPIMIYIRWIPNIYNAIVYERYAYYNVQVESLQELLDYIYGGTYMILYTVSLLCILLPFQLIKNYYYRTTGKISFLKKWGLLSAIFLGWIIIIGSFFNIWTYPLWKNMVYILFSVISAGLVAGLLYIFVDRYEENRSACGD